MSGESEIIAVPLVVGAAAVYGGAKLTSEIIKGTAAVAKSAAIVVNDIIQQSRVNAVEGSLGFIAESVNEFDTKIIGKMEKARDECINNYIETVEKTSTLCSAKPDMTKFVSECNDALNTLRSDMYKKRIEIEREYISKINMEVQKNTSKLTHKRDEIINSINNVVDDIEKRNMFMKNAEVVLKQASQMTEGISKMYTDSDKCGIIILECKNILNSANISFNNGQFEAALIGAYSVIDNINLRIYELAENERKCSQLYIDVKMLSETVSGLFDKFRVAEYTIKKKTETKSIIVDNFIEYYRGTYESLYGKFDKIKKSFNSRNFKAFMSEELEDMFKEISDIQTEFLYETSIAFERLDTERKIKKTAKHLIKEYTENRGYKLLPLNNENIKMSSLDRVVLKFGNPETGDVVEIKLSSILSGGSVLMTVDIEDHTKYSGTIKEVEAKRQEERNKICDSIQRTYGKESNIKQRCKNPGVR